MDKDVTISGRENFAVGGPAHRGRNPAMTLPVVDSDGNLSGLIVTRDLLGILAGGAELGPLVNAYDLCTRTHPPV